MERAYSTLFFDYFGFGELLDFYINSSKKGGNTNERAHKDLKNRKKGLMGWE